MKSQILGILAEKHDEVQREFQVLLSFTGERYILNLNFIYNHDVDIMLLHATNRRKLWRAGGTRLTVRYLLFLYLDLFEMYMTLH